MRRQHEELLVNKGKGHGEYREIVESEFLKEVRAVTHVLPRISDWTVRDLQVTSSKLVVCHFYSDDFESCKVAGAPLPRRTPPWTGHHSTRSLDEQTCTCGRFPSSTLASNSSISMLRRHHSSLKR